MSSAVLCLSSGLDSAVAGRLALEAETRIPLALTFDYGQQAAPREIATAARYAATFGIPHRVIALPWIAELAAGGALLGKRELPSPKQKDLDNQDACEKTARAVWVPNRNGVMLEIAAGFAEDMGIDGVLVGFNREEAATFPDNSREYLEAVSRALSFSTATQVKVVSPTAHLDKREIVAEGKRLDFDFSLTWSCYRSGEKMCGRCESCQRAKRAFKANEMEIDALFDDPILR